MLCSLYIKQIQWIRQRPQKVWSGERKKKALLRVVLQRKIKQSMVAKWHVFFVISLGKERCYCKHYEKLSGNPTGNVFVQDGDPSQNSKAAKTALDKIGVVKFSIPPCSPNLNPIKNAFNLVEKNLSSDALKYSISKESYAKFVERVENTLLRYPTESNAKKNIAGYIE